MEIKILEGYTYKPKSLKGVELPPRSLREGGINKTLSKPMIHVQDILLVFDVKNPPSRCVFLWKRVFLNFLKGTVSVISSHPPWKDGNARFTTVTLKASSVQEWIRYPCFCFFKLFIFICDFSVKVTCAFLAFKIRNGEIIRVKHFSSNKIFQILDQIKVSRVPL